eukprot:CAMPEP_0113311376 /NCGR_PEP_ID=MMETSP0010_2-20120614/8639_1 /TAXON_ID=216773 ORGANISM="Corethron hystrix, Strain 308" /NCGR_SAMPLE_ID=MMETSP0010_2 /ASSEMBLY_ACC=CAM_ASM_000155 /LENGTH=218 /DNA_ID=CAMNT_0000167005 /DNA_START=206 /DNA_END=862 /DNA_ORIENTATION=+ /assembly_acc=CAM_ASM_000155
MKLFSSIFSFVPLALTRIVICVPHQGFNGLDRRSLEVGLNHRSAKQGRILQNKSAKLNVRRLKSEKSSSSSKSTKSSKSKKSSKSYSAKTRAYVGGDVAMPIDPSISTGISEIESPSTGGSNSETASSRNTNNRDDSLSETSAAPNSTAQAKSSEGKGVPPVAFGALAVVAAAIGGMYYKQNYMNRAEEVKVKDKNDKKPNDSNPPPLAPTAPLGPLQ